MKDAMAKLGRSIAHDEIKLLIMLFITIGMMFIQPILICLKLEEISIKCDMDVSVNTILETCYCAITVLNWVLQDPLNKKVIIKNNYDEVIGWKCVFKLCPT